MLVRSSSYQSQYIFGKDFHLRRLQKVTTESFPPAGGNRKLIGHGIYVYIYIYIADFQGASELSDRMVLFYTAWEQWIHPGVDCLGTTCRTIFEFRPFRAFLFHQLLDPVSVRDVEPHSGLRHLFCRMFTCLFVFCVCFPIGATIHRKFWHLTFAHWVAAAKRTGGAKSHGVFCMWC